MDQKPLTDKILSLLEEILETKIDDPGADLTHYGMDSMRAIQLIVELETRYEIEFDDSELLLENFVKLNSIHSRVSEKLKIMTV